jgi:hypothetical protein
MRIFERSGFQLKLMEELGLSLDVMESAVEPVPLLRPFGFLCCGCLWMRIA